MDKEELRKEFYTVMEYSEPFGNEYHDELFNWMWSKIEQNSHKHGVMQGCQCKDRIGETTVWCCNQCGLPCEQGWLPTHKPVRQPSVGDGADGQNVSDGHIHYHAHAGSMQKCILCGEINDLDCG